MVRSAKPGTATPVPAGSIGRGRGLPNNLGMGVAYWDPAGVDIHNASGQLSMADNLSERDLHLEWSDLFDNSDSSLLPGIDAMGDRLDPTLRYKFINRASGRILSVFQGSIAAGALLDTMADNGNPTAGQQWRITSNNDGYFQIASINPGAGNTTNVLDDSGGSASSGNAVVQSSAGSAPGAGVERCLGRRWLFQLC